MNGTREASSRAAYVASGIVDLRDELVAEQVLVLDAGDARGEVGILLEALARAQRPLVAEARQVQVDEVRRPLEHRLRREAAAAPLLGDLEREEAFVAQVRPLCAWW